MEKVSLHMAVVKPTQFANLFWVYEGGANGRKRVTLVRLGMVIDVSRVRAIVSSEWPRETDVGYGT